MNQNRCPVHAKPNFLAYQNSHTTFPRKRVAAAIATTSLLALGAEHAWACDPSASTTITNGQTVTTTCNLNANQSLTVDSGGALIRASGNGVYILNGGGNTVANSGTIRATTTLRGIDTTASVGVAYSLTNNTGAEISGPSNGIRNFDATINDLINNGSILSSGGAAIQNQNFSGTGTTITNLNNGATGLIQGFNNGIVNYSATNITTLTNAGEISTSAATGSSYGAIRNRSGATIGTLINTSTGTITSSGDTVLNDGGTIGTLTNDGTIRSTGGASYYAINNAGTIANGITNTGLIDGAVELAGATLSLNGTTGRITGAVSDVAGTSIVNVNGTFNTENTFNVHTVAIANGGVFTQAHNLTIGAGGVVNSGTYIIGSTTQSITGNFTTTGTFKPGITSNSTYGKLNVTGNVTLGGTLSANGGVTVDGLSAGALTGIIHYTGTRTGTFTTVVGANSLFTWSAAYDDANKNVNLVLSGGTSGSGGSAGYLDAVNLAAAAPARGAAALLDQLNASSNGQNQVVQRFANVPQAQVANAVTQTLPLLMGGSQVATNAALTGINHEIQARQEASRGLSSGDSFYGDHRIWMKPFGSWSDQVNRKGVAGYSARADGIAFGADAPISDTIRIGASFAYARVSADSNSSVAPSSAKVDVYQLVGYGSRALDKDTEVNFQVGLGQNQNRGSRTLDAFGLVAQADYRSLTATAGVGVGRTYKQSETTSFTPTLRADYAWIKDEGYTETGANALNLIVNDRSTEELVLSVDGKLTHALSSGATFSGHLGLGYDALSGQTSITSAFAGAPTTSFTTKGLNPSSWKLRGGVGYTQTMQSGMEVSARYDLEYRDSFLNQTASVKLRWAF